MKRCCALVLSIGLVVGAVASAQETPPTPAPTPVPPTTSPAPTAPPDRAAVKQRWKEMSPEERQRLKESYERWKTLTSEQKALLRKRHENLDEMRRSNDQLLPDDERKQIDKQSLERRRKEQNERTLKLLKERVDRLPPDLKKRIRDELRDVPPNERAERMRKLLQSYLAPQIRAAFRRRVERGELSHDEVETLAKQVQEAPTKIERAHLLRDFILAHPAAFHLSPRIRERLRKNADPLEDLRLFDQERHGKGKASQPAAPRQGRLPKDHEESPPPAGDHRPA